MYYSLFTMTKHHIGEGERWDMSLHGVLKEVSINYTFPHPQPDNGTWVIGRAITLGGLVIREKRLLVPDQFSLSFGRALQWYRRSRLAHVPHLNSHPNPEWLIVSKVRLIYGREPALLGVCQPFRSYRLSHFANSYSHGARYMSFLQDNENRIHVW